MTVKQVIVIRKDLKMRRGKECTQAAHASMKVLLNHSRTAKQIGSAMIETPITFTRIKHWPALTEWLASGFTKICVQANSEEELMQIVKKAKEAGLPTALIVDSGKTEFHGVPTPTCAAIGPAEAEAIDEITGDLKLL